MPREFRVYCGLICMSKTCMLLVTHIMKHLEREEVGELQDDGMSELLLLRDKMSDMNNATDNGTVQSEQGTQGGMEGLRLMSQLELGAVQVTAVNATLDDSVHQQKKPLHPQVSMQPSLQSNPYWHKDR